FSACSQGCIPPRTGGRHCRVAAWRAIDDRHRYHQQSGRSLLSMRGRGARQIHLPPAMTTFNTHSADETTELGRQLATQLKPGTIVLLRGDLGAGKTTLVKGIAEGFHAARAEDVTSPTFTLIHEYRGSEVTLYHIDLYRIDTQRELDTLA